MQVYFIFFFIQPDTHILDSVELEKIFFLLKNCKRKKNTGYHLPLQIFRVCIYASEHEATDYPVKNNTQTRQQYSALQ